MDFKTQLEQDQYDHERGRAILYLDDFLYTATINDFVGIVNETVRKHYDNDADKRTFNRTTQQRVELTDNNYSLLGRQLATILPENLAVEDFALYVAEILKKEYGTHNFMLFTKKLINTLDNDTIR